jgi:hypothetical protein
MLVAVAMVMHFFCEQQNGEQANPYNDYLFRPAHIFHL